MITIPKISPEKFVWEKFCGKMNVSPLDIVNAEFTKFQPGVTPIGYCEASRLRIRPRTYGYAVLVELETGEECWLHVLDFTIDDEADHVFPAEPCQLIN